MLSCRTACTELFDLWFTQFAAIDLWAWCWLATRLLLCPGIVHNTAKRRAIRLHPLDKALQACQGRSELTPGSFPNAHKCLGAVAWTLGEWCIMQKKMWLGQPMQSCCHSIDPHPSSTKDIDHLKQCLMCNHWSLVTATSTILMPVAASLGNALAQLAKGAGSLLLWNRRHQSMVHEDVHPSS